MNVALLTCLSLQFRVEHERSSMDNCDNISQQCNTSLAGKFGNLNILFRSIKQENGSKKKKISGGWLDVRGDCIKFIRNKISEEFLQQFVEFIPQRIKVALKATGLQRVMYSYLDFAPKLECLMYRKRLDLQKM